MRKLSTIILALTSLSALALVGCAGTATGEVGSASAPMTLAEYEAKIKDVSNRGEALTRKMQDEGMKATQDAMKGQNPMDPNAAKAAMPKLAEVMKKFRGDLQKLFDEMNSVTPPAELKEFHEAKAKEAATGLAGIDAMVAAMEKSDPAGVQKAGMDMQDKAMKAKNAANEALKKAGYDPAKLETEKKFVKLTK